jgi:hypothetical protein
MSDKTRCVILCGLLAASIALLCCVNWLANQVVVG